LSGRYTAELKARRTCDSTGAVEYLGFLNKTCEAGTKSKPYGPTCGPVVRSHPTTSDNWKTWDVQVVAISENGTVGATMTNYYPSDSGKQPLCTGDMVPEKSSACSASDRLADRVHIHPDQPYTFSLVPVPGDDSYNIVADRGDGCLRFVGAPASCSDNYVQFYASDDGSGLQRVSCMPWCMCIPCCAHHVGVPTALTHLPPCSGY